VSKCKVCDQPFTAEMERLRLKLPVLSYDRVREWLRVKHNFSVSRDTLIRHFREHVRAPENNSCKICAAGLADEIANFVMKGAHPSIIARFCREKGHDIKEPDVHSHLEHMEVEDNEDHVVAARVVELETKRDLRSLDEIEELGKLIYKRMDRIKRLEERVESVTGPDSKTLKEIDALQKNLIEYHKLRQNIGQIDTVQKAQLNMVLIQQVSTLPKERVSDLVNLLKSKLGMEDKEIPKISVK